MPDATEPTATSALDPGRDPPTAFALFLVFARIGLTSFGGGLSGWLLREFVIKRRWMSEEDFLNGLALSQAAPGVNVTNMAIWIGYRLRGTAGAVAGVAGIVLPSACAIVALAAVFRQLDRFPATHVALAGAAAAAIGLSLTMAITTVRRLPRRAVPIGMMGLVFVAVGLLRWPLPWVVGGFGTASVAYAWWTLRR